MQKLDFIKNLETIHDRLKSSDIVSVFNGGFNQPGSGYDYSRINPLLFASKSNYDQMKDDPRYIDILVGLGAQNIYTEGNLSQLTTILRPVAAQNIIINANAISFFNFHNTIIKVLNLSKAVLQSHIAAEGINSEGKNGIVLFQILIEGDGLETEAYIKIFSAIDELVKTISKVVNEADQKSEIVLLDSGSDSNVGVKAGIETAKSLFLIFKEIWDFVTNFKYYKQKQKNEALLESLSIRAEINKKVQEGVLTEKEGLEYQHMIKTRTDALIGMKVLPKQIANETNLIENKRLLAEFEGMKMLMSGDSNPT